MNKDDGATISRATSVSRASKQGSTVSRAQSLIKKNIAPQDLRPSDVLIERFVAWKAIVKQLIAYFEVSTRCASYFVLWSFLNLLLTVFKGIADIQNNIGRELVKLGAVIQVPFRAGNQFLGEGGMQVSSAIVSLVDFLANPPLGCILRHPRQNPCNRRPARQPREDDR